MVLPASKQVSTTYFTYLSGDFKRTACRVIVFVFVPLSALYCSVAGAPHPIPSNPSSGSENDYRARHRRRVKSCVVCVCLPEELLEL